MGTKRETAGLQPQQSITTSFSAIGQPVTQEEGPEKVSGQALYAADLLLPGMLWGKVLRSPYPHAHILSIDTAKARAVPGVHAVLTGQDLPDRRVGRLLRDIPVLARDRVLFVGEKVAAVAAETLEAAEEALNLIDVAYEELPPVFDPEEAMHSSAPTLHPQMASYEGLPQPVATVNNVFAHNSWSKGDIAEGFSAADRIFEHTFNAQLMHQGYIEPHACVVHIDDHRPRPGVGQQQRSLYAAGAIGGRLGRAQGADQRQSHQHRWRLWRQRLVHGCAPVLSPGAALRTPRQNGHGLHSGVDGGESPASGDRSP